MIKSIIAAIFGLSCIIGAAAFARDLMRGNVWRWADEEGVHTYSGDHPPNAMRVVPNPLYYVGCAAFFFLGLLLVLAQVPSFERVGGNLLLVYIVGLVGVVATGAGVCLIVAGVTTAWRDHRIEQAADNSERSENELQSERATSREIEIDLDVQEKAQERLTGFVFSLLPPAVRRPAAGLVLLAAGIPALIQIPAIMNHSDGASLKSLTPWPSLTLLLIALIVAVWVAAMFIFGLISLTKLPEWAVLSVTVMILIGILTIGIRFHIYPSWVTIENLARGLFGGGD